MRCGTPVDCLLHKRAFPPALNLKIGSRLRVFVSCADSTACRISLALRPPLSSEELEHYLLSKAPIKGVIASIQPYGVFVDIGVGTSGLCHRSSVPGFREDL